MKPFFAAIAVVVALLAVVAFLAIGGIAKHTEVDRASGIQRDVTRVGPVIVSSTNRETWLSSITAPMPGPARWQLVHGSNSSGLRITGIARDAMHAEGLKHAHQLGLLTDEAATAVGTHVLTLWARDVPRDHVFDYLTAVQDAASTRSSANPLTAEDIQRLIAGHDPWADDE